MFDYQRYYYKTYLNCIVLLLVANLLILGQAFAQDYLELETPGISGIGVYYDEMFRGKVNPAAVGYRRESLAFDVANKLEDSDVFHFHAEYNTNRLSISDVHSELARVRMHFEENEVEDVYKSGQEIDELFMAMTSFNIDLSKSLRIGVGQRVSHLTGLHFERREEEQDSVFGSFDIDLTSFAVDVGTSVRLSRNIYLSLYGQNVLYFTFGEPSTGEVTGGRIAPELDVQAPIIVGGGPSIALAQLVASIDAYYLPQVGDPPGVRGTEQVPGDKGLSAISVGNIDVYQLPPARLVLSKYDIRKDGIIFPAETEVRETFEGFGLSGLWRLELPKNINDVDYRTIADVQLILYFDAYYDSELEPRIKYLVQEYEKELSGGQELDQVAMFSLRQHFPDEFFSFTGGKVTFELLDGDFPFYMTEKKVKKVIVRAVDKNGNGVGNIKMTIEKKKTNPPPPNSLSLQETTLADGYTEDLSLYKDKTKTMPLLPSPRVPIVGTWSIKLTNASQASKVYDLLVFFMYEYMEKKGTP